MLKTQMPLMPLNAVLFPGMPMPLVLWEARYLQMAQECFGSEEPFGVALIRSGREIGDEPAETYAIGTTAHVAEYDDAGNHLSCLAIGRRRFRIHKMVEAAPYPLAEVEFLPEDAGAGVSPEFVEDIRAMFAEEIELIVQLLGFGGVQLDIPTEAEKLSYMIAAHLRLPLAEKQALLELPDSAERLAREAEIVRKEREEYRLLLAARDHVTDTEAERAVGRLFSNN